MDLATVAPAPAAPRSYARAVAEAWLFRTVPLIVHPPAFTESNEPAVFFSTEEIQAALLPFQFAMVAKTPYGRPPFPEIKSQLVQQLGLNGDFVMGALNIGTS